LVEGEPKSKSPGVEDSSFTSPTGQQVINSPPKDTRPLGRKNSKKAIYEERVDTKQHEEVLRSLDKLKGLLREQNLQAKRKADGILEFNHQFRCCTSTGGGRHIPRKCCCPTGCVTGNIEHNPSIY
jgi:hypothetical protein